MSQTFVQYARHCSRNTGHVRLVGLRLQVRFLTSKNFTSKSLTSKSVTSNVFTSKSAHPLNGPSMVPQWSLNGLYHIFVKDLLVKTLLVRDILVKFLLVRNLTCKKIYL